VKCPAHCWDARGPIIGVGIHAPESSVCKSAIYDQSMPFGGGIVGVGVMNGLSFYSGGDEMNGLTAQSASGKTMNSFYTMKVDNFDMAESMVRIVDWDGKPAAKGRLEIRSQGVWGSVCSKDCNSMATRNICRSLGYMDGLMINSDDEEEICDQYLEENYCGDQPERIHFQALKC